MRYSKKHTTHVGGVLRPLRDRLICVEKVKSACALSKVKNKNKINE